MLENRKKEEVDVNLQITIHGNVSKEDFKDDASKDIKIIERPNTNDLNPENVIRCEMKVSVSTVFEFFTPTDTL